MNPRDVMKSYPSSRNDMNNDDCCGPIRELISRVFTTRNLVHFAHWATNSYAEHQALGELYDEIVSQVDEIVEAFQGKHGLIKKASTNKASVPKKILGHIKDEAAWVSDNRDEISNGCEGVGALVDELDAAYLKAIYKLENLK